MNESNENCTPCLEAAAIPANQLSLNTDNCKDLKNQTKKRDEELQHLQMELCNKQHEKMQLLQQQKLLKCLNSGSPLGTSGNSDLANHFSFKNFANKLIVPCSTRAKPSAKAVTTDGCMAKELRNLREQYNRLQEDYKNKICEVSYLRADIESLKCALKSSENCKRKHELCLMECQKKLENMQAEMVNKEQLIEQERALIVARQRFCEAQDELDEMRNNIQDQMKQTEEYRKKYIQAQQIVEEQRRQLELMEMDNARINENVTLEMNKIKNQFQEKLSELAPLPEILKETHLKLQESQRKELLMERKCEELNQEIVCLTDKNQANDSEIESLRKENMELRENIKLIYEIKEKLNELKDENEQLKSAACQAEELHKQLKMKMDEKLHEITQLSATIEQIREDSARQVARSKERVETIRTTMQCQISELEKQLAQYKAIIRSVQKDREEIRQKLQNQINFLNESFAQAQHRINLLQGHVNYLKDSHEEMFAIPNCEDLVAT